MSGIPRPPRVRMHERGAGRVAPYDNKGKTPPVAVSSRGRRRRTSFVGALTNEYNDQMMRLERTQHEIKLSLGKEFRHFLFYLAFLSLFTVVIFASRPDTHSHFFSERLKEYFLDEPMVETLSFFEKKFADVLTFPELWDWLEGPLLDTLYVDTYANGQDLPDIELSNVLQVNRILGAIRVRQLRVKKNYRCEVGTKFAKIVPDCWPRYNFDTEDDQPFGPGNKYKYSRSDDSSQYWGQLAFYGAGGYSVDLPNNNGTRAKELLAEMRQDNWVDKATRVIHVDVTVYNGNIRMAAAIRFNFEIPPSGGIYANSVFRTVFLFRYQTIMDYVVLGAECVFLCFIVVFIVQEMVEIKQEGWGPYLRDRWNLLDWVNILIFVTVIAMRVRGIILVNEYVFDAESATEFYDFQTVAQTLDQEVNMNAFNAFLCYFKVFKYIQMLPKMDQLFKTLSVASLDLILFLVVFFIIFFGYAVAFNLAFGVDLAAFSTMARSFSSLIIAILGEFDYPELRQSNRILGPLFFFSFMILVFFILMNMFLAIINDAYTKVQENERAKQFDASLSFADIRNKLAGVFKRKEVDDLQDDLDHADKDNDNAVDSEELRQVLAKNPQYAKILKTISMDKDVQELDAADVESIIKEFDVDSDGKLSAEEMAKLMERLEQRASASLEAQARDGNGEDSDEGDIESSGIPKPKKTGLLASSGRPMTPGTALQDLHSQRSALIGKRRTASNLSATTMASEPSLMPGRRSRPVSSNGSTSLMDIVLQMSKQLEFLELKLTEIDHKLPKDNDDASDDQSNVNMVSFINDQSIGKSVTSTSTTGVSSARGSPRTSRRRSEMREMPTIPM